MRSLAIYGLAFMTPVFSGPLLADSATKETPIVQHAPSLGVGRMLANPSAKSTTGQPVTPATAMGEHGLVIALTSTTCPISKKYGPTWTKLESELKQKGIHVLYVNAIPTDSADSITNFLKNNDLKAPYIHDAEFAKAIGATSTAEVILLDAKRTVVYRGAIDDQYGLGYQLPEPKKQYLTSAVAAMRAGREAFPAATSAPGCVLELGKATAPEKTSITYHNRISRIIQANCIDCHRDGGVGPFKLDTAEDLISHAGMIRKVVEKGTMPPWFAAAPAEGKHTPWMNDRRLVDSDRADLLAWLGGDRALGNPSDAPRPKTYPDGWSIGKPDQEWLMPQKTKVPAGGQIPYVNFTFNPKITEDRWVRSVEIRPLVPGVVHHVLVFLMSPDDESTIEPGNDERRGFFAAYVPGNGMLTYPDGYAKRLPKGAQFRFQIHYTPNGTAAVDQLRMAVTYAEKAPLFEVKTSGLANPMMRVPPGAAFHPQKAVVPVGDDVTVIGFLPHMHLRGVAARYEIAAPNGKATTLLDVPHYDFNWQLHYKLAEPIVVPKDSKFTFTAWYDNSEKNPYNPDSKKLVRWGQQTTDEMCLGYVEYIVPVGSPQSKGNGPLHANGFDVAEVFKDVNTSGTGKITFEEFAKFVEPFPRLRDPIVQKLAFDRLDKNHDGFIDREEFMAQFGKRR
ncbi:MAG: redoxin family protein [Gemmataceae bacterium]